MTEVLSVFKNLFLKIKPEVKVELHKENLTNLLWLNYIILAVSIVYLLVDIVNYNIGVWDNFVSQYATYILHSVTCLLSIVLIVIINEYGLNQKKESIKRFNIVIAVNIITYFPFLAAFNYIELRDHDSTGFIIMFFFVFAAILRVNLLATFIIALISSSIYFYMLFHFNLTLHDSPVHYFNGVSLIIFFLLVSRFLSVREIMSIENRLLLREKNLELEEAQKKIEEQNIFLTESNASFKNFAAIAAHDLKSPLRTIGSFTEIIFARNKDKYSEKDIELSNFVISSSKSLQILVDDILTFSDINENLPHKETFNLNQLINDVIQSLGISMNENNIKLNIFASKSYNIEAHSSLFKQLLLNLVSNSIKYKSESKEPFINITLDKDISDNNALILKIEDNGIGISKEKIHEIFIPFKKLHNKEYQGSGLGMSTCKKIVDFYDGTIIIESSLGLGTTITMKFPNEMIR